ncbi:MAG: TolC family protein [Bacteroidales bacterium]
METFPEDTQFSQKELIGTALKNRKDYRATQLNLQAQEKTVNAARAARWPTISLLGSYGTRWAVEPNVYPQGTHNMENVGRIGIALDLPVFDGKRIDAKIREEQAKLFAIKERLRKFEQQISLEIESAILNINSSRERIYALEKFIQQAEETLRIERLKYQLGKGAIIDVLDAQSALVEIQTNYYRALADYHVALSQLKLAIGEFL